MEPVVSGQATTCETLEGLLAFLARVFAECGTGPPEAGDGWATLRECAAHGEDRCTHSIVPA